MAPGWIRYFELLLSTRHAFMLLDHFSRKGDVDREYKTYIPQNGGSTKL
ncbi:hypothetical protein NSMM_300023 [Nitrosomonas mobilis]|uniref:Uncharacterized protein n=1 Tax=Nitrosomonas mobilis TaxID=51642 RepID=A0A1G5SCH9_9PROT|nr:hypothetical protein NSMM_300023 [Nitrosomonas mobilis]